MPPHSLHPKEFTNYVQNVCIHGKGRKMVMSAEIEREGVGNCRPALHDVWGIDADDNGLKVGVLGIPWVWGAFAFGD